MSTATAPRPLSLIRLSGLADTLSYQVNAAKLLAPFAPEASAQHLANARTAHWQIAKLLDAADAAALASRQTKEEANV